MRQLRNSSRRRSKYPSKANVKKPTVATTNISRSLSPPTKHNLQDLEYEAEAVTIPTIVNGVIIEPNQRHVSKSGLESIYSLYHSTENLHAMISDLNKSVDTSMKRHKIILIGRCHPLRRRRWTPPSLSSQTQHISL